jgi:hypothetical protein
LFQLLRKKLFFGFLAPFMSVLVDVDISQWKLHGKSVGYIRKVTSWTRAHFKAKQNVTGFVTEFLSDFLSSSLEERC